jgi:3-oxoacyl-[acyl-carrier protein] reductase
MVQPEERLQVDLAAGGGGVAPGPVATDLFLAGKSDEDIRPIVGRTPLGRLGEPEDIARAVSCLAGPDGAWINGQVLRANGGII